MYNRQQAMSYIPDAADVSARLSKLGSDLMCFLAGLSASRSLPIGSMGVRELYGLMQKRVPWVPALTSFCSVQLLVSGTTMSKVYLDLVLWALVFRLPENGQYMDVAAQELHMLEFFRGQASGHVCALLLCFFQFHASHVESKGPADESLQENWLQHTIF